jgi:hypothetical protein
MIEGVMPLANAVEAAALLPPGDLTDRVLRGAHKWLKGSSRGLPVLLPELCFVEAVLALRAGDHQGARRALEQSRHHAQRLHLDWIEARALVLLGHLGRGEGAKKRALALLQPYGLSLHSVPCPRELCHGG